MTKVKIISGTYGQHMSGDRVIRRNVESDPFELPDEEARRIVGLGVAEIVIDGYSQTSNIGAEGISVRGEGGLEGRATNCPLKTESTVQRKSDGDRPTYSEDTPIKDIRAIAKKIGISFKVGITKAEMVAELDNYYGEESDADVPGSDVEDFV